MDTTSLIVHHHARLQFGRRWYERDLPDHYRFTRDEAVAYDRDILNRIGRGIQLPDVCCQLFVKPDRSRHRKDSPDQEWRPIRGRVANSWGRYVFDGDLCFVVDNDRVVTIIRPDGDQLATLEPWLEQAGLWPLPKLVVPPQPLDSSVLAQAGAGKNYPAPQAIEICFPRHLPKPGEALNEECLTEILGWVGHAPMRSQRQVYLVIEKELRDTLAPAILEHTGNFCVLGAFEPPVDYTAAVAKHHTRASGYPKAKELLSRLKQGFRHHFFICSERSLQGLLVTLCTEVTRPCDGLEQLVPGTVYAVNLREPDWNKRMTSFSL